MRVLPVVLLSGCASVFGLNTGDVTFDAPPGSPDAPPSIDAASGDPSLLVHFEMDTIGQATGCLVDSSGFGHDGNCDGTVPTAIPGPGPSEAIEFLGDATGGVHVPSVMELEERNTFTVAAWIHPDMLTAKTGCPMNYRLGTTDKDVWQVCIQPDGTTFVSTDDGTPGGKIQTNFSVKPSTAAWSHVAVVYDHGKVTAYVNATIAAGPVMNAKIDYMDGGEMLIGTDIDPNPGNDAHFLGGMDDFRFYNRALDQTEVGAVGSEDQ